MKAHPAILAAVRAEQAARATDDPQERAGWNRVARAYLFRLMGLPSGLRAPAPAPPGLSRKVQSLTEWREARQR